MEQIRLTLTVPDGTSQELQDAADDSRRSKANLVALLVEDYLATRRENDEH
jgi:hypothetical protein